MGIGKKGIEARQKATSALEDALAFIQPSTPSPQSHSTAPLLEQVSQIMAGSFRHKETAETLRAMMQGAKDQTTVDAVGVAFFNATRSLNAADYPNERKEFEDAALAGIENSPPLQALKALKEAAIKSATDDALEALEGNVLDNDNEYDISKAEKIATKEILIGKALQKLPKAQLTDAQKWNALDLLKSGKGNIPIRSALAILQDVGLIKLKDRLRATECLLDSANVRDTTEALKILHSSSRILSDEDKKQIAEIREDCKYKTILTLAGIRDDFEYKTTLTPAEVEFAEEYGRALSNPMLAQGARVIFGSFLDTLSAHRDPAKKEFKSLVKESKLDKKETVQQMAKPQLSR